MEASLIEDLSKCGCQIVEQLLPRIVLIPEDTEAIAKLVRTAVEKRFHICPTGTGSSFPANYSPPDEIVFLMMNQMNQVLDLKPLDAIIAVESGMLTSELALKMDGTDLEIPPCLAEYPGTIGGALLGPDASGYRHAEIRRRILGVQLIDSRGDILSFGGASIKNVAGYDYWSFIVGTRGRFGILTHLILNIDRMPALNGPSELKQPCSSDENPTQWIYANLCKGLDPDGIFVR